MSISAAQISYAIGSAAWGSTGQQEGLPVTEHSEPERVIDAPVAVETAKAERLPSGLDCNIGRIYHVWQLQMIYTPAHAMLFLDKFFEAATAGASPNYTREYDAEDILSDPVTPYLNVWKKTAKVGHDHNLCCSNGIVTGISFSKSPGKPMIFGARCAFGACSLVEPDPAHWDIDRTHGLATPPAEGTYTYLISPIAGGYTSYRVTDFNLNLSCEFTPHFWNSQSCDRFSRGKVALSGDMTLRDITDEVETFSDWLQDSTSKKTRFYFGGSMAQLFMSFRITGGTASEDDITRTGKFNFTGVQESEATYPSGFHFTLSPGRVYSP